MQPSDMPERIWAWRFMPKEQNEHMQGGWCDSVDAREASYIRADRLTPERVARSWWCLGGDVPVSGYQRREATAFLDRLGFDGATLEATDAAE